MKQINIWAILVVAISSSLTAYSFNWNYCSSKFDVDIYQNDLTDPIKIGSPVYWDLIAFLRRPMKSEVRTNVTLVRWVGTLSAPVRCMIINGEYSGSCSYPDLCDLMMYLLDFSPNNCPPELVQTGIDCNCPFNLNPGLVDVHTKFETNTPAFMNSAFLVRGFYRLRVEAYDMWDYWFCLDFEFTIA